MKQNDISFGMAMPKRDFTNIRILLRQSMVSRVVEFDDYIARIIHDAQAIVESTSNISTIDREVFYYSVYLGEKGRSWIENINPNNLKEEDYKKMLEVFEMP